jgi:hypothetical protein
MKVLGYYGFVYIQERALGTGNILVQIKIGLVFLR